MTGGHPLSLAHVTALQLPPAQLARLAAGLGLSHIGLRLMPATPEELDHALLGNGSALRETLAAIADSGVRVLDVEVARLRPESNVAGFEPLLEAAARLRASHVVVTGHDPDPARLAASFAALCALAQPYGVTANLEFMRFTQVPDLAAALDILSRADQPNSGVLVDSLHFDRSRADFSLLRALPRRWLHYAQLCDAPADWEDDDAALIYTARQARLAPGTGGIDLSGYLAALPSGLPLSLEVPCAQARGDPAAWAAHVVAAARQLLNRPRPLTGKEVL